ncbi:hypothetical protein H0H92_014436 [Tricholoma furcatifolium]|nr:hypothetical protein H0H92_014436 [Tricholoma furcatifolium]
MSNVLASSFHLQPSSTPTEQLNGVSPVFSISTPLTFAPPVQPSSPGPSSWQTRYSNIHTSAPSPVQPQRTKDRTPEELELTEKASSRLSSRLASDHALALSPDVDTPFRDTEDVLRRLLPYHVFHQPQEDLALLTNVKGKGKAKEMELEQEIEETKFALECHKRRDALLKRFRDIQTRHGKRHSPDDQAILISSLVLDVERSETTLLGNELRTARAEQDRREKEKRLAARPAYYAPGPMHASTAAAVPAQYYRAYPYAYTQVYGTPTPVPSTSTFPVSPAPSIPPTSAQTAIPVQLPVASLPALHALGIVPVPAASLVDGQPQPAAVLRGSTSNGTMLSLEINVSLLQSAQMSGLAMVLNSLMSKSSASGSNYSSTPDKSSVGGGGPMPSSSAPTHGPLSTTRRRERLMRIGSGTTINAAAMNGANNANVPDSPIEARTPSISESPTEYSSLPFNGTSYGTLPIARRRDSSLAARHSGQQPPLGLFRRTLTLPVDSTASTFTFSLSNQRPISSYDTPSHSKDEPDANAKVNGIRVWYSSFSSIDWLHDAIKDSARFSRLRKRQSLRSQVRLVIDKSLGWFVVTIVGFLSAIVAFLVVRSELWLFDIKEGYCHGAWWNAKRFCCPALNDIMATSEEETCERWRSWVEVFSPETTGLSADVARYMVYAGIALSLAFISSYLTISLTKSTTFVTRKESGVLSPDFPGTAANPQSNAKRKVMYYAAGSGIPEIKTILSGFVIHGYLGGRVLFTKSIGLALSVASGLSLGKEGPFVHIASCIGNIVSRFFSKYENNEAKRREILSAACAAGVAVAFGAPIGGTLFSLEEVSYFFPPKVMWRSFFCAMIAAITLKVLDPFGTGKLVLFQVTYGKDWHAYELFPFLLLGVFGGVYGAYFSKLNYSWSKHIRNKTWLKAHPIAEVLIITAITTALAFINPFTRMGGTELVYSLFAECHHDFPNQHAGLCSVNFHTFDGIWPVISAVSVAMVVKACLTIVTFGIKVPAGIFIPSLGVGACAGRVMGIVMKWLQYRKPGAKIFLMCTDDEDCIIPGLYAMVGAAATLSGVTRTTVSLAVIMFELTDTLTYAVPVMLSVLVAKTVADALEPKGIYDLVIELNQLPYLDSKHEYLWGNLQINDVTARDVDVIRLDRTNTVETLRDQLLALMESGNDDGGFPILRGSDDGGLRMVGYIGVSELEHALSLVADGADTEVHFHTTYTHFNPASSISSLMDESERQEHDLFDFSDYMDQAPLTVQSNSPLEMIHQFFVKLGARYVVVTDTEGLYEGVIDKKTWIAFLADLEEK